MDPCIPYHWGPSSVRTLMNVVSHVHYDVQYSCDTVYCSYTSWNSFCVKITTMYRRQHSTKERVDDFNLDNWERLGKHSACCKIGMSSKVQWSVSGLVPKKYVLFRKTTWMLKTQRLCVVTKNPKRMLTLKDELSLVTTSDRGVKTWCVRTPYPEREWQVSWWFHPRNLCASVRE